MKYSLTITDASPSELAKLLATLNGSTASPVTVTGPATTVAPDDDESGDAPATVGQLDGEQLPHDPRIHSEPAKLTTKGIWRKRRGVEDALVKSVEAELRARNVQQAPIATMPAPMFDAGTPAPTMPVQQPQMPAMAAPQLQQPMQVPQMPGVQQQPPAMQPVQQQPAPVQPVPAPQPAPTGPMDFNQFMGALTTQMSKRDANGAPLIDAPYLVNVTQEIATAFNTPLSVITDISNYPQMIGYAIQIFQRDQRWN